MAPVIPAQAGIQSRWQWQFPWIAACAGMTNQLLADSLLLLKIFRVEPNASTQGAISMGMDLPLSQRKRLESF